MVSVPVGQFVLVQLFRVPVLVLSHAWDTHWNGWNWRKLRSGWDRAGTGRFLRVLAVQFDFTSTGQHHAAAVFLDPLPRNERFDHAFDLRMVSPAHGGRVGS